MVGLPPLPTPGLSFPEPRTVVLALSDETVPSPGLVAVLRNAMRGLGGCGQGLEALHSSREKRGKPHFLPAHLL